MIQLRIIFFIIVLLHVFDVQAQREKINYIESKVPEYQVPDVLTRMKGGKVKSEKVWFKKQRPELLRVFTDEVYGKVPGNLPISEVKVWEQNDQAFNGFANRKQLSLFFINDSLNLEVNVLIYLPKSSAKVPVFLACNFNGNHTICNDPYIRLTESWVADYPAIGIINNQVTEQSRASASNQWPVETILKAGYGLVTFYYGDVDPDKDDFRDGIHPFFYKGSQSKPLANEWGSIAAWAWGLSRVMDVIEKEPQIDAGKVALLGHSRLGKTALWAGANDQRFAMVISNESGCGGAALSRREFGETVQSINTRFPHWFCDNFKKYNDNINLLPVDQHELLACIAPRPLYVSSAEDDQWADPKGEFLAAMYATDVYKLLGLEGLPIKQMPEVNKPVMGTTGYHIRSGKHDINLFDWQQYITFADKHLKQSE